MEFNRLILVTVRVRDYLADAHTAARLLPSLFLFVLTPNVAGDDDSPRLLLVLACVAEDSVLSP